LLFHYSPFLISTDIIFAHANSFIFAHKIHLLFSLNTDNIVTQFGKKVKGENFRGKISGGKFQGENFRGKISGGKSAAGKS